jgi:hypothetical protein
MGRASGFWVSPHGEAIRVTGDHISAVIANPKVYGYTKEKLEEIFKKHGEEMHVEDKAKEEIILDMMRRRWIRLREFYGRNDFIRLLVQKLDRKTIDRITDFFTDWKDAEKLAFTPVKITDIATNSMETMPVHKIRKFGLYKLNECERVLEGSSIIEWLTMPLADEEVARICGRQSFEDRVLGGPINESVKQILREKSWR